MFTKGNHLLQLKHSYTNLLYSVINLENNINIAIYCDFNGACDDLEVYSAVGNIINSGWDFRCNYTLQYSCRNFLIHFPDLPVCDYGGFLTNVTACPVLTGFPTNEPTGAPLIPPTWSPTTAPTSQQNQMNIQKQ